jgi:hypothetical protein
LARQAAKDKLDGERKRSLANRTKFFGEAMKNVLWKFPQDPAEIPGYFEHIENLFTLYEVDDDVKSKLLQAQLTDRAKSLTVRLTLEQLNDYDELKEFLLNEFKISPIQLRERFFSLRKKPDETYTLLASKLHNALMYYVRSRNISDDFDKLVSLFCADRLKELVPKGCLDFILAQEKDGWMKHDELAHSIDTYMASHDIDGNPFRPGGNTVKRDYRTAKDSKSNESDHAAKSDPIGVQKLSIKPNKEEATRKGLCFICAEPGHRASQCKKRVNAAAGRKSVNSSACAAEPSPAVQPVAPAAANQQDVQMNVSRGACEAL